MPKGARIHLPKEKTHTALYSKKLTIAAANKIDKIVEELEVSKWLVIDAIICNALGVKHKNPLDIKKYLKGLK